ncbi:hypothetical protein SLA2020_457290 [Shorea laevis]
MDGEEGEGLRLSKRFSDKAGSGEVDYKVKAGTAWSHSYLNQKPWHPLSYPNQRRKWIAEQSDAQKQRRAEEVAREYAQEQEFFRQTALISKKEKEKVEMMKAVSFMYVRPPGYNAESAKAAEIDDERKRQVQNNTDQPEDGPSAAMPPESLHGRDTIGKEKKKPRPKDVFGRPLPTEEEFEILKNAPRLETGVPARVKPFGVEVRNVKCLRCGNYGHQSGDRECPLKDVIMPNEESRLKRDDPLNAIIAQIDPTEPLKWELKQKPGLSPPRGGFKPDDPNQQIVAEEIFDEYGGFLSGGNIPELLTNFSSKPKKRKSGKKRRHKRQSSDRLSSPSDADDEEKSTQKNHKKKKHNPSESNSSDDSDFDRHQRKSRNKHSYLSEEDEFARQHKGKKGRQKHSHSFEDTDSDKQSRGKRSKQRSTHSSEDDAEMHDHKHSYSPEDSDPGRHGGRKHRQKHSYSFEDSDSDEQSKGKRSKQRDTHSSEDDAEMHGRKHAYSPEVSHPGRHRRRKSRQKHSYSSEDSDSDKQSKGKRSKHIHLSEDDSDIHRRKHSYSSEDSDPGRHYRSKKSRQKHSYTSKDDFGRHHKSKRSRQKHSHSHSYEDSDPDTDHRRSKHQSRH